MKPYWSILGLTVVVAASACADNASNAVASARQASAPPDAGAIVVGSEVELAPEVPLGGGMRFPTGAAFNGDVYLAVWTNRGPYPAQDLMGARFARDGTLLDPGGFLICSQCTYDLSYGNLSPAVGATLGGFLVVWEFGWATVASDGTASVHGGNILPEGLPTDPPVIPPFGSAHLLDYPMIACSPDECLVVWLDDPYNRVLAGRVDGHGAQLGPNFLLSAVTPGTPQQPAVAWNGNEFMVAWGGKAVRVTPDGELLGAPFSLSGAGVTTIASNGDGFFVGWNGSSGTRVDANGGVLDSPPLPLGNFGPSPQFYPYLVVASHAGNYKALWQQQAPTNDGGVSVALVGADVSASGVVGPSTQFATDDEMGGIAIAGGADGYLLVWGGGPSSTEGLEVNINPHAVFVGAAGVGSTMQITGGPSVESDPAVAHAADEYLVAWAEPQTGEISCARIGTNGGLLDSSPLSIASGTGERRKPSVASDGTAFAVAWDDTVNGTDDIYAALVSSAGVVSSSTAIASGSARQVGPSIASNGSGYLLVWEEATGIHGARLAADLSVLGSLTVAGSAIPDAGSSGAASAPSVASNGADYLAVWVSDGSTRIVHGARIRGVDGTILDPSGLSLGEIDAGERPSVEWDGSGYLVVWKGAAQPQGSLHGVRVALDGAVTAADLASASTADGPNVGLVCGAPMVVWRAGDAFMPADVFGTLLSSSGSSIVAPIASTPGDETSPAISGRRDGALVTYVRGGRVFARLVTSNVCASATDGGSSDAGTGGAPGAGGGANTGGAGPGGTSGAGGSTGGASGMGTFDAGSGGASGAGGTFDAGSGGASGAGGTFDAGSGGLPGTGGVATGGVPGTGGTLDAGSSGRAGTGGASGRGGATGGGPSAGGGTGGRIGDAGIDAGHGGGGESGCGCRTARRGDTGAAAFALLGLLVSLGRRARERRRSAAGPPRRGSANNVNFWRMSQFRAGDALAIANGKGRRDGRPARL